MLSAPPNVYWNMERCGACLEVTGPKSTEIVQVVDLCPSCPDNQLVINKPAFERIAGRDLGRASITWREVPCAVDGNIAVRFKETSSQYWTALQIRDHRRGIRSVAFKRGQDWIGMLRSSDNYFVAAKGVGKGPLTLRITATDGQQLEDTLQSWKDGKTYTTSVQIK